MMASIANGSQAGRGGMLLIVDFRRILDQQHPFSLARFCSRLLHMRLEQLLIGDIGSLQEALGRVQIGLACHRHRQRGRWLASESSRHRDRSLGATLIPYMDRSKGVLGPLGR